MKQKIIRVLFVFLLAQFLLTSCDSSTNSLEENPPGYQEDIAWPSLADSPWPMYRCDPQNTGRSKFIGPREGTIVNELDSIYNESGCVAGLDGVLFIGNRFNYKGLFKVDDSTRISKLYDFGNIITFGTVPILTNENSVIVSDYLGGNLHKISMNGDEIWSFNANAPLLTTGMTLDKEGNIYIVDTNSKLLAVSNSGNELWNLSVDGIINSGFKLGMSPNGEMLYITGTQSSLTAVNILEKKIEWKLGSGTVSSAPMIDSEGNVYLFGFFKINDNESEKGRFVKISSSGEIIWDYLINDDSDNFYLSSPAIDRNGNLYFAGHNLYSLDNNGNFRWEKELNGIVQSPLLCDKENVIFVSVKNDYSTKIIAFDENGVQLFESGDLMGDTSIAPSLGEGKLFYPTYRSSKFYTIK